MNNIVTVNVVLQRKASSKTVLERVLWLNEIDDAAFIIEIYSNKGLPIFKRLSTLRQAINSGEVSILEHDPWAKVIDESTLTEKQKHIRDTAWAAIEGLVSPDSEPAIYDRKGRSGLILKAAQDHHLTIATIYKYLRKFWQRGKVKNALLPDYDKSGGPGKPRSAGKAKRGRPRKYAFDPQIGVGINIDESIQRIFRVSISKFYNTSKENPLKTAYDEMLREYFVQEDSPIIRDKPPILIPPDRRPTIEQFRYWYEKETDKPKSVSRRKGQKNYNLNYRAILGSATAEVYGPGSRFELDATVADVYLVSRYNRNWIIGRPVVYVVIDVFSRMIVGLFVGLEGPSWVGAMMALANVVTPKASFCQEYGILIVDEEWPCHFLPEAILGDRGEMASRLVEALIQNLNIRIETAAPYRADWKPIVERNFRTQERVKPFLPGYVIPDASKRTGQDYRLDATLDIHQFTQIIIHAIRFHNSGYLNSYNRSATLIADDVPPIPIKLWEWGIKNRSGRLRTFPEDIVKLNLLPTARAKLTERGIVFKDMRYSCDKALKENWFDTARIQGHEDIEITYDFRNVNYAYIKGPGGRSFEKCYLLDSEDRYHDKTVYEVDYLHKQEEYMAQRNAGNVQQSRVNFITEVKNIVEQATDMTSQAHDNLASKASRISNIKGKRATEKEALRKEQAFELNKSLPEPRKSNVVNIKEGVADGEDLSIPSYFDLLAKKREELKDDSSE
jgi:hypothetical protein